MTRNSYIYDEATLSISLRLCMFRDTAERQRATSRYKGFRMLSTLSVILYVFAFLVSPPAATITMLLLHVVQPRAPTINVVVHVHCTRGAVVPGAEQMRQEEPNDVYDAAEAAEWETPVQETRYQHTRSRMVGCMMATPAVPAAGKDD